MIWQHLVYYDENCIISFWLKIYNSLNISSITFNVILNMSVQYITMILKITPPFWNYITKYYLVTFFAGRGKYNSRSKRPGRRNAGSMASMRFVAPITMISPLLSSPSIRARRVETILAWIWSCFDDLTGAKPSISSKKIIDGRFW